MLVRHRNALDFPRNVCGFARDNIAVFGRSLGGAVAIHLAARNSDKVRPCSHCAYRSSANEPV